MCCLVSPFSFAAADGSAGKQQCSASTVALVGSHFGVPELSFPREGMYPSAENGGTVISAACKAWPVGKSRTIAAIAHDAGVQYEKRLLVALVEPTTGTVLAAYAGSIQEDAAMTVATSTLRIDTARYDLAPGVRAFGIDASPGYLPGCVEGGLGPVRTLFIQEERRYDRFFQAYYRYGVSSRTLPFVGRSEPRPSPVETISYGLGL
jgi:hypothetical protein